MSQGNQAALKDGQHKEMDSLLEPPEENVPRQHLDLCPVRLVSDF